MEYDVYELSGFIKEAIAEGLSYEQFIKSAQLRYEIDISDAETAATVSVLWRLESVRYKKEGIQHVRLRARMLSEAINKMIEIEPDKDSAISEVNDILKFYHLTLLIDEES